MPLFEKQTHALVKAQSPRGGTHYECRCGKNYFSHKRMGYAGRDESRTLHREHMRHVEAGIVQ